MSIISVSVAPVCRAVSVSLIKIVGVVPLVIRECGLIGICEEPTCHDCPFDI
jgi:hypothetical protein